VSGAPGDREERSARLQLWLSLAQVLLFGALLAISLVAGNAGLAVIAGAALAAYAVVALLAWRRRAQ
jgi:hypothetical protein